MSSLFDTYKIIKTIDSDEITEIYLVEEIKTGKTFALRKLVTDTSSPLYHTAIKELTDYSSEIDENPDSPSIVDFFVEEGRSFLLLSYSDEETLKRISSYPSIGKILNNRYAVIRGIARGGFGTVYLARDLSLPGKYWALKEMMEEGKNAEVMEKSFRVEAEMLSRLEHPGIPRISDFFVEGGKLYLVMDYVKGETLKKKLKDQGKGKFFSEEEVISWTLSLCDVLSYLHSRPTPVVFRDLKPDNIMITPEGELKLIDFGIARVFRGPGADTTKYALLTEGFAPQEQWMGKAEPRSDIYSLGVTMYYLLTGVHPREVAPNFPPAEKYNPSLSPVLSNIIKKALEPKLHERFQSVEEMKGELLKIGTEKEKKEKAAEHLKKATEYENREDFFNANFEYMKALDFQKDNHAIYFAVARCCEKLGFSDKAMENYKKVLDLTVPQEVRDEILKKLKDEIPQREDKSEEGIEDTIALEKAFDGPEISPGKKLSDSIEKPLQEKNTRDRSFIPEKRKKKGSLSFIIPAIIIAFLIFGGIAILITGFYPQIRAFLESRVISGEKEPDNLSDGERDKLDKGFSLYEAGDFEGSLALYDEVLKENPESFLAWQRKGLAIYRLGNYEDALVCFNKAVKLYPQYMEGWHWKGLALCDLGRCDEGIECYNKAIELDPHFAPLWSDKGLALYYHSEYEEALKSYDEALKLDPGFEDAWYRKGEALLALGRNDEAIESYDRAIEINPQNATAWSGRGNVLYYEEKYDEAIECFDRAIENDPWYPGYLLFKAQSFEGKGNYEEALRWIDKALEIDPEYSPVWQSKGLTYYNMKDYENAIKCYDRAIEFSPDDSYTLSYRGIALTELGHYEEAISSFDRALELDSSNEVAENNRKRAVELMEKRGDYSFTAEKLKNMTYRLNGFEDREVTLTDGKYHEKDLYAELLEDMITYGDINNDGMEDAAVIINYNGGGSGSFYDVALVVNQKGIPVNVASALLGDRVVVQCPGIVKGHINVEILDRKPDEPMAAEPTVRKFLEFEFAGGRLVQK